MLGSLDKTFSPDLAPVPGYCVILSTCLPLPSPPVLFDIGFIDALLQFKLRYISQIFLCTEALNKLVMVRG